MSPRSTLAAMLLVVTACASACASAGAKAPAAQSTNSDVLTAADIERAGRLDGNTYEAVRRLRGRFLTFRGVSGLSSGSAGQVLTSIDGGTPTPAEALRNVPARNVAEVRYLSASDAAQRFGALANSGPVILVRQK